MISFQSQKGNWVCSKPSTSQQTNLNEQLTDKLEVMPMPQIISFFETLALGECLLVNYPVLPLGVFCNLPFRLLPETSWHCKQIAVIYWIDALSLGVGVAVFSAQLAAHFCWRHRRCPASVTKWKQSPKMAKKTLTWPGLEPETSGLTYQRSSHPSYPALDGGGPK